MTRFTSFLFSLLTALVVSTVYLDGSDVFAATPGDVAPRNAVDNELNNADIYMLRQFLTGEEAPTLEEISLCDVAPLYAPDGQLNVTDYAIMQKALTGQVALPAPVLAIDPPYLWGSNIAISSYYISGLTIPGIQVNIYNDGTLVDTTTSDNNGLFNRPINLAPGGLNMIYVKAEINGIESADSNILQPVAPVTVSGADLSKVSYTVDSNGYITDVSGAAGAVGGGTSVTIYFLDGTTSTPVMANGDGSFDVAVAANSDRLASIVVADANGNVSEPAIITTPGTIAGTFKVDPSGAASYSIPIAVPPGTAGMAPSLSLNYNSNAGNGIIGRGWSLGGLSAITRCPQTMAQDGQPGGVNLDANDRFCLDGQRLIAVSGVYGADGTEYRTEIEAFTKVISFGRTGNSPDYFTARTKAGQLIEYGNSATSEFNPQGGDPLLWAANYVEDKAGNYYRITYQEDDSSGEHYPLQVAYTGNASDGLSPYNTIQFIYETRPDSSSGFVGGTASLSTTQRLKNIHVYDGPGVVRDYRLGYGTGPVTGHSRLVSIMECDAETAAAACMKPTTFAWSDGQADYESGVSAGTTNSGFANSRVMDVNGDGRQDLVVPHSGSWWVNYGDSAGLLAAVDTQISTAGHYAAHALTLDYDGNGMTDLLVPRNNGYWDLLLSNGAGFDVQNDLIPSHSYGKAPRILDYNGDGLDDLLIRDGSNNLYNYYLNSVNGFGTIFDTGDYPYEHSLDVLAADYNTDGKVELLVPFPPWYSFITQSHDGVDHHLEIVNIYKQGSTTPISIGSQFNQINHVLDINGDGIQEFISSNNLSWWYFALAKGSGEFTLADETTAIDMGNRTDAITGDYNSDGKSDLFIPQAGIWRVFQSTGIDFQQVDTTLPNTGYNNRAHLMDVNGDGMQDIVTAHSNKWNVHFRKGEVPDRLRGITNGLGINTDVIYKPITDDSVDPATSKKVYEKGAFAVFPEQDFQAPYYVVSQTRIDDGIGGEYVMDYAYAGAKVHRQGRGFLGFREVITTDYETKMVTTTRYRQDFPYIGMPEYSKTEYFTVLHLPVPGIMVDETTNTLQAVTDINGQTGVHFPYVSQSVQKDYDLPTSGIGGNANKTVTTDTVYDMSQGGHYGNPKTITVTTQDLVHGGVYTKLTTNTYDAPDLGNWILDRVNRTSVLHQASGTQDITRTSTFTYNASGLLSTEIIEPDQDPASSPLYLKTAYQYDAFGNKTRVTSTGLNGHDQSSSTESRITETQYDTQGRFPEWTKNALGHQEDYTHDSRFGTKSSLTGPNGLPTSWVYDSFGRKQQETRADGTVTTWSYSFCSSFACPNGGFIETVTASGSSPVTTYHDALQRVVRTHKQGLQYESIYQDTAYDHRGNVASKTRPYIAGSGQIPTTTFLFDTLNRPVREDRPDGGNVMYEYHGLVRDTKRNHDAGAYSEQVDMRINNAMDQLIQVIDAKGGAKFYHYDAAGNLTAVSDNINAAQGTIVTSTAYDLRGRKTSMDDPDMGFWEYKYNAFGELVWQKDAKNQVVTMAYDPLGRMVSRTEPEGTSTWTYDVGDKATGKLSAVSAAGGHSKALVYDDLGRLASETSTIDNIPLAMAYTYDGFSRRETVAYPTGFIVRNVYNDGGYLVEVKDAANDHAYWTANVMDAEGHVTSENLGNGLTTLRTYESSNGTLKQITTGTGAGSGVQSLEYEFDALGNLKQRRDSNQNLTETFVYDDLNRLREATLAGVGTRYYDYDAVGNVLNKSDFGDDYSYGANNAGPHAVTEVKNGGASQATYTYDSNGNMETGDGRTITWTSFNKAATITKGTTTLAFDYDADHNRVKQDDGMKTIYYLNPRLDVGDTYHRIEDASGTEHMHYIQVGGRAVAIYTQKSDNTEKTIYLHTDHLGSTDVITDESGQIVKQQSFSAFGGRRNTDWSGATSMLAGIETRHGFTGHEHLDEVGIIHMNGRLYDPKLGRFLSPDIQVQYPDQTQSFNRYTYVNNNPLSYTDPSGYGFFSDLWKKVKRFVKKWGRVFVAAVAAYFTAGFAYAAYFNSVVGSVVMSAHTVTTLGSLYASTAVTASIISGAVGGFTAGLIMSKGDLKSAMLGALTGAAFGVVGGKFGNKWNINRVLANGSVGGISAKLQGGKFADGFKNSGLAASARYLYNKNVKFDVDIRRGGEAMDKLPDTRPYFRRNNIGVAGKIEKDSLWGEGGRVSRFANHIPGVNAVAGLHDVFQIKLDEFGGEFARLIFNVPGMPVAAGVTYAGFLDGIPSSSLVGENIARDERRRRELSEL